MPKLINIDEECKLLPEIKSAQIFKKNKFDPDGLFSEQIFGPIKKYTCQCGIIYGRSQKGYVCPDCNVEVTNSKVRRRRFGKIKLSIPVLNPTFLELLYDIGGKKIKHLIERVMFKENIEIYKQPLSENIMITENKDEIPPRSIMYERLDGLKEIILNISKNSRNESWKIIENNIDCLIIKNIIVLPADMRPIGRSSTRDLFNADDLNKYYIYILNTNEQVRKSMVDISRSKQLYFTHYVHLQKYVISLYDHIHDKLSKKKGLVRGNILGKRIDFSGRAVIVPDPSLNLDECRLPYLMVLELYKLNIARKLVENGSCKLINEAIDFIDDCIEFKNRCLYNITEKITEDEYCLLNRQPTLHKLGILAFKIKLTDDNVIKIHPLVCAPYNADFDGDQMAVYIPISQESKKEAKEKFLVTKNFSNPTDTSLSLVPNQDIILGIYLLTCGNIKDYSEDIEFKNIKMNKGLALFNSSLPENFRPIDYIVGSKELIDILTEIKNNYSEDETKNVLDRIKDLGFKFSTKYGVTLSIDEMLIDNKEKIIKEIFSEDKKPVEILQSYSDNKVKEILREKFKYSYFVESGARGSWDQVKQVVLARGFISDFNGNIHLEHIKSSLLDGLTPREFFISTYGCRKGLLDVAVNTGESGYMSRKLIFTCANLELGTEEDCKTNDFLNINVDNEDIAKSLLFRYIKNERGLKKIDLSNYKSLIGSKVKVRSPIFCKNPKICRTCYGDLYSYLRSKYIGVIAAQCLGECNTQLVLRTFHSSGIARVAEGSKDLIQCDVISDLNQISSILHSFPEGCSCHSLTRKLFDIYNSSRKIQLIHFECLVCQLMWFGNEKWRLTKDRSKKQARFKSILTVPSQESWLLGFSFIRPKHHIIKGLQRQGIYKGVFDTIMEGNEIKK